MKLPQDLASLYPFKGHFFKTENGHNLHYLDEGNCTGVPTLFLHGNPTWSFFYRNLINQFQHLCRCIAPDHIGCGLSDKPSEENFKYDLKSHSENINALLNHLKISKVNLVVHDWGGAIGLTAFRNKTHLINKLVILNTAAFQSQDVPKRILICRLPVIGSLLVRGLNLFAKGASMMASKNSLSPEVKRGFLYPYDGWQNRIGVWKFVKDIPYEKTHPTRGILQETEESLKNYEGTPKIACWGMKDFCFHGGFLKIWTNIFPEMVVYKFSESGHYLLEDDLEGCRSKIEPFLFS